MLLWERSDAGTRLRRTERGRPDRQIELTVPAGWDYAAAPDGADVVGVRGREVSFGRVATNGIELDTPAPFLAPEAGLTAACVGRGMPAALLTGDVNHFLVAFRDGGFARIDAIGTLGDCTWLDGERLLTVGQGAGDPIMLHPITAGPPLAIGVGGRDPRVSGGLLVVQDRTAEPAQIVAWRTSQIVAQGGPAEVTRMLPAEVARLRPVEPGTRYLSGTANQDGSWLAIVGDIEQADGSTDNRLWLVDLRTPELTPMPVPVDFSLSAVTWPG